MKRINFKRKREHKTDYKRRLTLLKSRKPRLVVRITNKNIILQIVEYNVDGDKVLSAVNTKTLEKYGWKNSKNNVPAAYLGGLLLAKSSKIKEAVLDTGLQTSMPGGRIYSALKGVVDGGLKIPHSDEVLPSEERIKGTHIDKKIPEAFVKCKEKILK